MQALKDNGIAVIPMKDFLAWRQGEKNIPPRSCIITIDDGYVSGYSVAWPILKRNGYPCTMFIYTNYVNVDFSAKSRKRGIFRQGIEDAAGENIVLLHRFILDLFAATT